MSSPPPDSSNPDVMVLFHPIIICAISMTTSLESKATPRPMEIPSDPDGRDYATRADRELEAAARNAIRPLVEEVQRLRRERATDACVCENDPCNCSSWQKADITVEKLGQLQEELQFCRREMKLAAHAAENSGKLLAHLEEKYLAVRAANAKLVEALKVVSCTAIGDDYPRVMRVVVAALAAVKEK